MLVAVFIVWCHYQLWKITYHPPERNAMHSLETIARLNQAAAAATVRREAEAKAWAAHEAKVTAQRNAAAKKNRKAA